MGKYDASIDLPMYGKTVIHTVPICEGSGCLAVCQFICTERERMMINDDGAYHPENTSHFRLLTLLLTFVQKHLDVVMPKPVTAPPPVLEAAGSRNPSKRSSVVSVENQQEDAELNKAAVKLQSVQRGRLARRSTTVLKEEEMRRRSSTSTVERTGTRGKRASMSA